VKRGAAIAPHPVQHPHEGRQSHGERVVVRGELIENLAEHRLVIGNELALGSPFGRPAQYDPVDRQPRQASLQLKKCSATADLNVVTVRPNAKDAQCGLRFIQVEVEHRRGSWHYVRAVAGCCFQIIQGQSPRASLRSKLILSLNVSMHCQKPSQRYAMSLFC